MEEEEARELKRKLEEILERLLRMDRKLDSIKHTVEYLQTKVGVR